MHESETPGQILGLRRDSKFVIKLNGEHVKKSQKKLQFFNLVLKYNSILPLHVCRFLFVQTVTPVPI